MLSYSETILCVEQMFEPRHVFDGETVTFFLLFLRNSMHIVYIYHTVFYATLVVPRKFLNTFSKTNHYDKIVYVTSIHVRH
jgi:hypothetical protein